MSRSIQLVTVLSLLVFLVAPFSFCQSPVEDLRKVASTLTSGDMDSLRTKAEAGDSHAQTLLAIAYQNGTAVPLNEEVAAHWLRKAADQGFPPAQNMLGNAYDLGIGVTQDRVQSLNWYKQAARRGYPAAQFNVGNYYERDSEVKDLGLAYAWWTLAAENGDATARDGLMRFNVAQRGDMVRIAQLVGDMLLDGEEVPQDVQRGEKWLQAAAKKGSRKSAERLIRIYLNGGLLPKDIEKALHLLESTAELDQVASLRLADMYAKGQYLPQDDRKAFQWELHSFELMSNSPRAPRLYPMFRVATAYLEGRGVPKDRDRATMLLFIGAALGDAQCQQQFRELQLSPKELEKTRKDAKKWLEEPANFRFYEAYKERQEAAKSVQTKKTP